MRKKLIWVLVIAGFVTTLLRPLSVYSKVQTSVNKSAEATHTLDVADGVIKGELNLLSAAVSFVINSNPVSPFYTIFLGILPLYWAGAMLPFSFLVLLMQKYHAYYCRRVLYPYHGFW